MRLKIIMLVSLITICGAADALTFNQSIHVEGDGNLSATTTTDAAKDAAIGKGEQEYSRDLYLGEGATNLVSKYYLTSDLDEIKNRYYVQMNGRGIEHKMDIHSSSDINSVSSINQSGSSVKTDYAVDVKMGEMSEGITFWGDYDDGTTGSKIAETEVSGNFTLHSKLSDEEKVKEVPGWSADQLLEQLDNAAKTAETVPPEEQVFTELKAKAEETTMNAMAEEGIDEGFVVFGGTQVTPELVVDFKGVPLGLYAKIYRTGDIEPKIYKAGQNRSDIRPMIFLGGKRA